MNNELKITKIPIKYEREIAFMLHNYNRIDKLIEKRKRTLIENMNVTNGAYLKAVHSVHSNVLEDVIDKFETDANILRLKEWKKTINVFCSKLYDDDNKLYYYLIKYKYFLNMDEEIIKERLNLNSKELKQIDMYLKWILYQYAIKSKIYEEAI